MEIAEKLNEVSTEVTKTTGEVARAASNIHDLRNSVQSLSLAQTITATDLTHVSKEVDKLNVVVCGPVESPNKGLVTRVEKIQWHQNLQTAMLSVIFTAVIGVLATYFFNMLTSPKLATPPTGYATTRPE